MPLTLDKVHHYQKVPGRNEVRLVKVQPYVRFVSDRGPAIICQGGAFYSDGGQKIPLASVPVWVWDAAGHFNKGTLAEVKFPDRPKTVKQDTVPKGDTPLVEEESADPVEPVEESEEEMVRRIVANISGDEKKGTNPED